MCVCTVSNPVLGWVLEFCIVGWSLRWLFCLRRSRHSKLFCFLLFAFAALASARCRLASCVAPVRGGTYFSLPAAKKSRQKKAATNRLLDHCFQHLNCRNAQPACRFRVPHMRNLVLRASYEVLTGRVLQITHCLLGGFVGGDGGVKRLSLVTFFAAAKKVTAAPHRGNASNRGNIKRMPPQKKPKPATASQTKNQTSKTLTPTSTRCAPPPRIIPRRSETSL